MIEENIALVRRYFDMWNTGDGSIADSVLATTYVDHAHPHTLGPAAARALVPRFHAANPELRMTIEVVAAAADFVAVRNTIHGAAAAPIAVEGLVLFRIEHGKLAEQWTVDAAPFALRGPGPSARQVWHDARRRAGGRDDRVVVHDTLDREVIVVELGDDRVQIVRVVDGRITNTREYATAG
jgi:hypothetical protein